MPFFYVDWYYIVLVLPAVILSLWASAHVKSTFRRYSQVRNARGMTGAEAAMAVLRAHGVTDVRVEHVSGELTDHFDPKDHVIRLSDSVYNVATPAAVGVAAHEAGHAVQYARHYAPIYIRAAIVPVTNIGSRLSMPLIVLGLALSAWPDLLLCGAGGRGLLWPLRRVPARHPADGVQCQPPRLRAIEESALLLPEEQTAAKRVLTAAALTYVAALSVTIMQFLRLLLIVAGGNRRRD